MKKSVIKVYRAMALDWAEDSKLLAYAEKLERKNSDIFTLIYSKQDMQVYIALNSVGLDEVDFYQMFNVFKNLSAIFNEREPYLSFTCECENTRVANLLRNICDMQMILEGDGIMGAVVNNYYCNFDYEMIPLEILDNSKFLLENLEFVDVLSGKQI